MAEENLDYLNDIYDDQIITFTDHYNIPIIQSIVSVLQTRNQHSKRTRPRGKKRSSTFPNIHVRLHVNSASKDGCLSDYFNHIFTFDQNMSIFDTFTSFLDQSAKAYIKNWINHYGNTFPDCKYEKLYQSMILQHSTQKRKSHGDKEKCKMEGKICLAHECKNIPIESDLTLLRLFEQLGYPYTAMSDIFNIMIKNSKTKESLLITQSKRHRNNNKLINDCDHPIVLLIDAYPNTNDRIIFATFCSSLIGIGDLMINSINNINIDDGRSIQYKKYDEFKKQIVHLHRQSKALRLKYRQVLYGNDNHWLEYEFIVIYELLRRYFTTNQQSLLRQLNRSGSHVNGVIGCLDCQMEAYEEFIQNIQNQRETTAENNQIKTFSLDNTMTPVAFSLIVKYMCLKDGAFYKQQEVQPELHVSFFFLLQYCTTMICHENCNFSWWTPIVDETASVVVDMVIDIWQKIRDQTVSFWSFAWILDIILHDTDTIIDSLAKQKRFVEAAAWIYTTMFILCQSGTEFRPLGETDHFCALHCKRSGYNKSYQHCRHILVRILLFFCRNSIITKQLCDNNHQLHDHDENVASTRHIMTDSNVLLEKARMLLILRSLQSKCDSKWYWISDHYMLNVLLIPWNKILSLKTDKKIASTLNQSKYNIDYLLQCTNKLNM